MASLSSISIKRPVLAIVMSIVLILFGIIGLSYLGIREYPSVDPPIITVNTTYVGANADIIESQITEPLEESINGISGIRSLSSTSRDGSSNITVEFQLGIDLENAANDVRDKVSGVISRLPPDVNPPTVAKADADANPILAVSVSRPSSGDRNKDLLELSEIAENIFKERLQTVPEVSSVIIWGQRRYSMRLWIDPEKLAAYGLAAADILNALNRENIELPSGRIEGKNTELTIRTLGRLNTEEDFNNLIIKQNNDNIVRFKDIGKALLGAENDRTILKRDGIPMVAVAIVPQPGANQIAIADEIYKRLEKIKKDVPADIKVESTFDNTKYIRASISEVEETIISSFVLVVIIIFLFLREWRSTLIPVLTIPISLIGTFFIMYLCNFSINVLTLLGIVLAIGLVVDDAIVVLENIYTKIEEGMDPLEAAFKGSEEILFAVVSTTIALAAVFLPVVFLEGLTGRLFREFGIVVAGSVLISAFVALTLTPMLSGRILKRNDTPNWFYRKTEPFFQKLTQGYRNSLEGFMKMRWLAFVIMAISGGLTYLFFNTLPSELAPLEDRNAFRVSATAYEGASFEYTDRYLDSLNNLIAKEVPEKDGVIAITAGGAVATSVNSGFMRIILKDRGQRTRSQQEIVDQLMPKIGQLTEARSFIVQEPTIGGGGRNAGLPVQFVLQAPDIEKLQKFVPKFMEKANQSPKFSFVDINLKFNKPEIRVTIDRDKARNLGVNVLDIAQTLQLSLSGQRFGYFIMSGKQYQIIGQLDKKNRDATIDLRSLYVKNNRGELIQLDNLVTLNEESTPPQLYRENRYSSATVSASLAKNVPLGEGIAEMDRIAKEVLDESFSTSLAGSSRDFMESSSSLLFAFILALVLIYLVLAAQFESFTDPFVVMFTVPLALAGALLSLWYFNQSLNIFSQIGMIMLIGLVTKNGILIVEFANQRKEEGLAKFEAAIDASVTRFRPILMTSLATILGILPIALALGAGAESRVSMGIAVVGGLIFATGLTLYIIPALYSYMSKKIKVEKKAENQHLQTHAE